MADFTLKCGYYGRYVKCKRNLKYSGYFGAAISLAA
jgi:hypothetical protein